MIRNRIYKCEKTALKKTISLNKKTDTKYLVVWFNGSYQITEERKVDCMLKCGIIQEDDIIQNI